MISVIIPVYNVEKYIRQCLDSIINQTYKNIEIILVDDGSPDNSGSICDEYAKKDNRIKVIHKENGGLSSARNAGLDIATGDYIAFIDSDDYVKVTLFEEVVAKLEETKADVCMFSHYTTNGVESMAHSLPLDKDIYSQEEVRNIIYPKFFGKTKEDKELEGFVWRQIFKRQVIGDIRFRSERDYFAEDIAFDLEIYGSVLSLCVINEPLYYYRYVASSLSNKYRENLFDKLQNLICIMFEIAEEKKLKDANERIYNCTYRFAFYGCRNYKNATCLTKRQKIEGIRAIANNAYVIESLKKIHCNSFKERIFSWLLKRKMARLILFLI